VGWTGDPVWLADVLRAEGLTVVEYPGWRDRGRGDFGDIWGVICHHTGSNAAGPGGIAEGRPDLAGPLSQLHLAQNGTVTVIAAGIANHAGTGYWRGLGLHAGNKRAIGVEAANDGTSGWPAAQYWTYVKICAAINRKLGYGADHVIAHWEYDNGDPATNEGKWDPGGLYMPKFREDIQAQINGQGDDMANVPQDQWDRLFREFTQKYPSRSKYRSSDGLIDTAVGMVLNVDAMSHEALIERNALLGNTEAIALVKREADKGDKWAQLVYAKSPK